MAWGLSYFCPCCYVVAGWDGARQCHTALCLYTLALYYLIPDNPSLSPSLCCFAEHKHTHVTSLMASLSPFRRLWLCTFTLSVAVCAVLLLPISILSNEVLLSFPQSYYMQWLNGSLIHGTSYCVYSPQHQTVDNCRNLSNNKRALLSKTRSVLMRITGNTHLINTQQACVQTDH